MRHVLVHPPVVNLLYGNGIQIVPLLATHPPAGDETGVLEYAQVLGDAETCDRQVRLELGERESGFLEQPVQEVPSSPISQCLEDLLVFHPPTIGDYLVTCQCLLACLHLMGPAAAGCQPGDLED